MLWPSLVYAANEGHLCDANTRPKYPLIGSPPVIQTWKQNSPDVTSTAPDCAGLNLRNFTLLVAVTGSFSSKESGDALLVRFGSISSLRGTRYWSVTDSRWETLITDAAALDATDIGKHRSDFTFEEMKNGKNLYFFESDNRSSNKVIYRMNVLKATPDSLEVATANISKIRLFLLPMFDPGDIQTLFILERMTADTWGYYSLSAIQEKGIAAIEDHEKSYINRAIALYRQFVGIPTDQVPH